MTILMEQTKDFRIKSEIPAAVLQSKAVEVPQTMEDPIAVMKRYEFKYFLNPQQKEMLTSGMQGHMMEDQYGLTSIASLYYDTPDYRLVRASNEKPAYKEKIRLRSYGPANENSPVYLELKRKAHDIVYKRRVQTTIPQVSDFFERNGELCREGQISREITFFRDFYGDLQPSCLIIYDRTAYFEPFGDLRLTIDDNPRYRMDDMSLSHLEEGNALLDEGISILEIKVQDALPLWLCRILSAGKIYKNSFSKYGEAYRRELINAYGKEH
ncbi:MAG: polyphosphate polymerase domain-containing protein [Erysipelotrichaceae bacterium]|nr:polyphosphate polymerase domain-containing protein [Erysipelotrichaceae bacterium]